MKEHSSLSEVVTRFGTLHGDLSEEAFIIRYNLYPINVRQLFWLHLQYHDVTNFRQGFCFFRFQFIIFMLKRWRAAHKYDMGHMKGYWKRSWVDWPFIDSVELEVILADWFARGVFDIFNNLEFYITEGFCFVNANHDGAIGFSCHEIGSDNIVML